MMVELLSIYQSRALALSSFPPEAGSASTALSVTGVDNRSLAAPSLHYIAGDLARELFASQPRPSTAFQRAVRVCAPGRHCGCTTAVLRQCLTIGGLNRRCIHGDNPGSN